MTRARDDLAARIALIRQSTVHRPEVGMTLSLRAAFLPEVFARPGRDEGSSVSGPAAPARFSEQIRRALLEDR